VRLKSFALNILLLFGSVSFALVVLELLLRAMPGLMPEEAQLRIHWRQMANADTAKTRPDPYLGFLYPPNARGDLDQTNVRFEFRMDSHGFRNLGTWPDQADVVAVGDSWVFSYGVNDEEAWPRLVERSVPGTRVINLGLSGFAPEQYTRSYERFGAPLHPKVLLYGIFPGNDLVDTRDFERWLAAGSPGDYNTWRTAARMRQLNIPIVAKSYVALLVKESWRNREARFTSRTVTWGDGSKLRLAGDLYRKDAGHAHSGDPQFEGALAALERARTLAAGQGTKVVVLLFPTKEEVYLPLLNKPVPRPLAPFAQELARRGITYIDFRGPFTTQAKAGRSVYLEVDPHPNQAGYALIASTVSEYLERHATALGLKLPRPSRSGPAGPADRLAADRLRR
jgi:acetyltransferase AlgX (SGNH hydrolase-like protein)